MDGRKLGHYMEGGRIKFYSCVFSISPTIKKPNPDLAFANKHSFRLTII
jgi:hypothetical protein